MEAEKGIRKAAADRSRVVEAWEMYSYPWAFWEEDDAWEGNYPSQSCYSYSHPNHTGHSIDDTFYYYNNTRIHLYTTKCTLNNIFNFIIFRRESILYQQV